MENQIVTFHFSSGFCSLSVTQPQSLCFEISKTDTCQYTGDENRPESRPRENWTRCYSVDVICRGKRKR